MKRLLQIVFILCSSLLSAQVDEVYVVNVDIANVRSGPGTEYAIVAKLKKETKVVVLSVENSKWYKVDLGLKSSYIYASLITEAGAWEKKSYRSGAAPNCENIISKYDYDLDNYLNVQVGKNTDVCIKVMKVNPFGEDYCIRIAYVRASESYKIKNIPEGKYYLKIAYGKDWRQKIENGKCVGQFMRSALYEKGDDILDYTVQRTSTGQSIPVYSLTLDVVMTDFENQFQTDQITVDEFNE